MEKNVFHQLEEIHVPVQGPNQHMIHVPVLRIEVPNVGSVDGLVPSLPNESIEPGEENAVDVGALVLARSVLCSI